MAEETARRPPNWNRPATPRSPAERLNEAGGREPRQMSKHRRLRADDRYHGLSDSAVAEARKDLEDST